VTLPATWYSSRLRWWASNRKRSTPSLDKKNSFQSDNSISLAPDLVLFEIKNEIRKRLDRKVGRNYLLVNCPLKHAEIPKS